jgi:hypothetical protein
MEVDDPLGWVIEVWADLTESLVAATTVAQIRGVYKWVFQAFGFMDGDNLQGIALGL